MGWTSLLRSQSGGHEADLVPVIPSQPQSRRLLQDKFVFSILIVHYFIGATLNLRDHLLRMLHRRDIQATARIGPTQATGGSTARVTQVSLNGCERPVLWERPIINKPVVIIDFEHSDGDVLVIRPAPTRLFVRLVVRGGAALARKSWALELWHNHGAGRAQARARSNLLVRVLLIHAYTWRSEKPMNRQLVLPLLRPLRSRQGTGQEVLLGRGGMN